MKPLSIDIGVCGVLFDKLTARSHIIAHQHGEDMVSFHGIFNRHLTQGTVSGIHRGFPQLFGVHLTQTFVALHVHCPIGSILGEFGVCGDSFFIGPAIAQRFHTAFNQVERWCCAIDITVFNQLTHIAEEERQDEGSDVTTVDIGIGHDDDLMVAQFLKVQSL